MIKCWENLKVDCRYSSAQSPSQKYFFHWLLACDISISVFQFGINAVVAARNVIKAKLLNTGTR